MLQIDGITKSFGERIALHNLTMSVEPGSLTGFVGANGAGKTTTMRIVMGLLKPDEGVVTWDGHEITNHDRRTIGYLPEERGLYPKQGVHEQLTYFGRVHGMTSQAAVAEADRLLESFGLMDRRKDNVEDLSLGNQQRVQIAVALIHSPRALILDEPFSGLDPDAVEAMAATLRTRARGGIPVLFSSHQLDLVERLCDKLVIIADGRVVAAGTADELRAGHERVIRIRTPNVHDWIHNFAGIRIKDADRDLATFIPTTSGAEQRVLEHALGCGPVTHYGDVTMPLSELYQEVTR